MSDPASVPRAAASYRWAARIPLGVMRAQRWRLDIDGAEHVPSRGGAVIAANHIGHWDFFTVAWHPYVVLGRPVRILAKASLFEVPVVGGLMRRAGHVPVERTSGSSAYRAAVRALRAGELVLVLPEQTISPSFELMAFRAGAARMAAAAGVPLVPAASWGSHRFVTAGRWPRWSWRLPVSVGFGTPLTPGADEDAATVTADLRTRVAALLDQAQRRYPDGAPAGAWWVPHRLGGGAPEAGALAERMTALRARWAVDAARRRARDTRKGGGERERRR